LVVSYILLTPTQAKPLQRRRRAPPAPPGPTLLLLPRSRQDFFIIITIFSVHINSHQLDSDFRGELRSRTIRQAKHGGASEPQEQLSLAKQELEHFTQEQLSKQQHNLSNNTTSTHHTLWSLAEEADLRIYLL
jgi:hypothetical protein